MPYASILVLLLALLSGSAWGCSVGTVTAGSGAKEGQQVIHARVVSGAGGARLVLVPVYIQSRGPYDFALDTGAARSLVDSRVANQLRLPSTGTEQAVTGISGTSEATRVRVSSWRVDSVELPPTTILSLRLPSGGGPTLDGLLGSDMLSRFQIVTVNYPAQTVTVR
jgi:predicted aspartyl protease